MMKALIRVMSGKIEVGWHLLSYLLPVAWYYVLAGSGAGADFYNMPRPKKIVLSIGTLVVAVIWMAIAARKNRGMAIGCLIPWAFLMLISVFSMWFWN